MLRVGASSGAQVLRNIAGIPSGPLDLEVSSWRRVWRTYCVENLMGDMNVYGYECVYSMTICMYGYVCMYYMTICMYGYVCMYCMTLYVCMAIYAW